MPKAVIVHCEESKACTFRSTKLYILPFQRKGIENIKNKSQGKGDGEVGKVFTVEA